MKCANFNCDHCYGPGEGPTPLKPLNKIGAVIEMLEMGLLSPDDVKTLLRLPSIEAPILPMTGLAAQIKELENDINKSVSLPPIFANPHLSGNEMYLVENNSLAKITGLGAWLPKAKKECTCYTLLNGHLPECSWGK